MYKLINIQYALAFLDNFNKSHSINLIEFSSYSNNMKRTKENWKVGHPEDRNGISGLFTFDGEDRSYQDRKKEYQSTQKQWIEEQKLQKQQRLEKEAEDERNMARQTLQANRLRGLTEDNVNRQQKMMMASVRDANLQLKAEKEAKEKYEREQKMLEEQRDLQYQRELRKKGVY